ncbi:MAG: hypothetical protein H6668_22440 [Ardenticatenaceae bacterium]|nr:hypothetical protein [Ardenticatenaceae bacterium]
MSQSPAKQALENDLLEQAATIRYVERAFLTAQLSKYSALLFTLIALLLTPLLDTIWPVVPGAIWLILAYHRQKAAADKLVELERDQIAIQKKLTDS